MRNASTTISVRVSVDSEVLNFSQVQSVTPTPVVASSVVIEELPTDSAVLSTDTPGHQL